MPQEMNELNELNENVNENNSQDSNDSENVNPGAIRKSTTQSILKAMGSALGQQFTSVEDMLTAVASMNAMNSSKNIQKNEVSDVEPKQPKQRVTNSDLEEKFQQLQNEMKVKEQKLRERELDNNIRNYLGDRFDNELIDYTMSRVKAQLVEQDGEFIVVNNRQQQRYNDSGKPMSVKDLIEELARDNPKLLKQQPVQGGSGLRPQSGMYGDGVPGDNEFIPDYSKDPAAFNMWASKRGLGRNNGLKGVTTKVFSNDTTKRVM